MIDLHLDMNLTLDFSFAGERSISLAAVNAASERIIFNSHFLRSCYEKYSKKDNISYLPVSFRTEGIRTNERFSYCSQDISYRAI